MPREFQSTKDESTLERIRKRFDQAVQGWAEIRKQGGIDMRYVSGDPWEEKDKQNRENAGRPALALDELGQYFNQVINNVRANPRAVKFAAIGSGANDESEKFYQNKMREIEYRSNAQMAYTSAFENAVQRSYGFVRVKTEYESFRSHYQNIVIDGFPNPDMVLPDPTIVKPDASDMRWCFVHEFWDRDEFKREHPTAKHVDFDQYMTEYPAWFTSTKVVLAEYWEIEERDDVVEQFEMPDKTFLTVLRSETTDGTLLKALKLKAWPEVVQSRKVRVPRVTQRKTNGVEILSETAWPGDYIPIVMCSGKAIYVNTGAAVEKKMLSMTRLARDPYMLYCYYRTTEAELVGMTPKTPWVGRKGQFHNPEQWQKANSEPVAFLEYDDTMAEGGDRPVPPPARAAYSPAIEPLEIGAESSRRAIQASMGISPLPTSAQRQNQKSGVALRQIEESQQKGTFHFVDNYDHMIRHVGVISENLMDKVYDTARDVGVIGPDDVASIVRINDENIQPSDAQEKPVSTKGEHRTTISTGPAFESQRMAASEFADQLASHPDPEVFALLGPLIVKLKNLGPIGDEMVELLESRQPPGVRKGKDGDQPDPAQMQQQLMQADEMLQVAQAKIEELGKVIETDQIKEQARTERDREIAEIKSDLAIVIQEMKGKQAREQIEAKADEALKIQDDAQRHETGLNAAEAGERRDAARQVQDAKPTE